VSPEKRAAYRELANTLSRTGPGKVEVMLDSKLKELPSDASIWVFDRKNLFADQVLSMLNSYSLKMSDEQLDVEGSSIPLADHSFVMVARHPKNPDLANMLLTVENPEAFEGLARKLPHYHKYSYLGFSGPGPENVLKGRWPVVDSPLTRTLSATGEAVEMGALTPARPLAELPPPFSADRMQKDIEYLASERLEGRGFGSVELDQAAEHIAGNFRKMGLLPGGNLEYYQEWMERGGRSQHLTRMRNVVGVLKGSRPEWEKQSVVVGAHYDHLGHGWPGGLAINQGRIHPGADDNASGVAVMLELARIMADGPPPQRTIIFAAFTGEEDGKRGSRQYVNDPGDYPVKEVMGMVNLDTVGRMDGNQLLVLGGGSAAEWVHIFRGAGYLTGVDIKMVSEELDSSDQVSFHEVGVPGVHLFTGPNADYHKPSDKAGKINSDGLVKVAAVMKEAVDYLAGREEPLASSLTRGNGESGKRGKAGTRKVSFGIVPDFTFDGDGVRIKGTVPGSPAEAAGLKDGDIITSLNGKPVKLLVGLSDILKELSAGDKVPLQFLRGGEKVTAEAVMVSR
jgi:hypothetical protein